MNNLVAKFPSLPYLVPFATFALLLMIGPALPLDPRTEAIVRVGVLTAVIVLIARPALTFRMVRPLQTVAVGIGVFILWIAPDQLISGYRESAVFQNGVTGTVESSMTVEMRNDPVVVFLRFVRAALIVPIVEELFWRGFLSRWVDNMDDFRKTPLGQFSRFSFWAVAILFAMEHGPYWEVGLVAGIIYNWWMMKTRNLGDLIWCHAVTNACLSGWVLVTGQWQYW
ncbi:MAG: CAAX prenyl protease-related protein [Gemmatimonadetes bacterium]|nr:CAAX prenyl protease-related protein [Gemmatimonadota bacterium]